MFFFARSGASLDSDLCRRGAASLGVFAGRAADSCTSGDAFFSDIDSIGGPVRRGWRVARSPQGWPVLFAGWIDNCAELADALGQPRGSVPATLYGAAVDAWGDAAESRIVGDYAALIVLPDGNVRLSRAPWGTKALFWARWQGHLLVSSIPRPLFAAGMPQTLRADALDALLSLRLPSADKSLFEGIATLPHGAVAHLGPQRDRVEAWYDPARMAEVRLTRDEEVEEATAALLSEAARAALAPAKTPGIMLSGGLDSALVADELLCQMPPEQRLPSFTFRPLAEWDGVLEPGNFGDETPFVEAFARDHPRLDPTFVDNRGIDFDDRAEALFLAASVGFPARVMASPHHGVFDAAARAGCDWLFHAGQGNATISNGAPWALPELFRCGRWLALWRHAQAGKGMHRHSPLRRIASQGVLPWLPSRARNAVRRLVHPGRDAGAYANPLLRADGRLGHALADDRGRDNIMTSSEARSREEFVAKLYHVAGIGAETVDGYEQVFKIRLRDVTNYRPLLEFCLGLPTRQFVRGSDTRFLARRLARGRLPEAQRTNPRYGRHNVDWHARLTPRRDDLRRQVEAMAAVPEVASALDLDRAHAWLDAWPERTPDDPAAGTRLMYFLPAMLYVSRYVAFMTGRNERGTVG